MAIGRPKTALILSEDEREQLSSLARDRALPHAIVARAKVVLWSPRVRAIPKSQIGCSGPKPLSGSGADDSSSNACGAFTTSCAAGGHAQSRTKRSPGCSGGLYPAGQRPLLTGPCAERPRLVASPSPLCIACSAPSRCSPIALAVSNFPTIRSSSKKCAMSRVCI